MPRTSRKGQTARSKLPANSEFGRRKDYSHQRLSDRRLSALDLRQSLFIGALIEGCVFENVDFSRCDFSGTKIVRCTFQGCRFGLADIRSCEFDEVRFDDCDLRASHWSRTRCRQAAFRSCVFERSTLLDSTFLGCRIEDGRFRGASVTTMRFEQCRFERSGFADCTALFLFFEDCAFDGFVINAESVGFTYGLSLRDLDHIRLVYLGKQQPKPSDEDLVLLLSRNYDERKWHVGAAVLALNFRSAPVLLTIKRLVQALHKVWAGGLPFDVAELSFFCGVLARLRRDEALPLLGLWLFDNALRLNVSRRSIAAEDGTASLIVQIDRVTMAMLDQAVACLEASSSPQLYELTFRLDRRPSRPLENLLRTSLVALNGPEVRLEFIAGREGSWTEIWRVSHDALFTVELLLFMATGALKAFEEAAKSFRKTVKAVGGDRGPKRTKSVGRRHARATALATLRESPVGLEIEAVRNRSIRLSADAVLRIDAALMVMSQMSDDEIAALADYGPDRLEAISVKPAKRPVKRRPRGKPRAA